jgi:glycosyltransferase involved in cell wall biosynthesis
LPAKVRAQLAAQERRLIKRVAAASTVNEFIADIMASEYGIEKPIVIYNSVPMTEATVRPGLRAELSIPEDARLLIFQGWLSSIRGVDDVIRGVEFMDPSIHFLVVGYGDVLSDLQRLAYDCGVADRVHFTGRVEPEEMLSYTLAADLGVIPYKGVDPNYYYCSPNKLFEFTMAGLPMVASNLPFLARIGRDYGHVHAVNVADPKALAEAVNDILLNPERLRALQSNAVEARNLLHWGHDEERLFAMYERVLAAAGKSSPREAPQSAH